MKLLALFAMLFVGCSTELRPGRCNRTSDCGGGLVCARNSECLPAPSHAG